MSKFKGDKKKVEGLTRRLEIWLINKLAPLIPKSIETYHLTLSTILWSALIIIFGFLSLQNIYWLIGICVMIFFQYITDILDGEIGRRRKTGLIKWGYYMDHFLDYIFLIAVMIAFYVTIPEHYQIYQLFILMIFGGYMISSLLAFAATNEFEICFAGFGPTESRIFFILVFVAEIIFSPATIAKGIPYIITISGIGLIAYIYKTHKKLWAIDMKTKNLKNTF